MSRSKKKIAIVKDHTGRWYNKVIRRIQKLAIKRIKTLEDVLEYNIPHPNEIVNKYDISDWKFFGITKEWSKKLKRK